MQSVDVAIVGGGMVGLAVACGLQGIGLRVEMCIRDRIWMRRQSAGSRYLTHRSQIRALLRLSLIHISLYRTVLNSRAGRVKGVK